MFRYAKAILIIIVLLLRFDIVSAGDLEVRFPANIKKEIDPGATFNLMIKVVNNSDVDKSFSLRIANKDGYFKFISDCSSFPTEKKSSLSKIIGVQVSNKAKAGNLVLSLEAVTIPESEVFGKTDISVDVKSKFEISISKIKAPQTLFSGDTASIYYLVQNLSNDDVSVKTTALHGTNNKEQIINIKKDSASICKVPLNIPKTVTEYSQQTVVFIASVIDKPGTEKSEPTIFDVFPIKNIKFDRYERFPLKAGIMVVTSNRLGKQSYSTMYEIQGEKSFGKDKTNNIEFRLRGPDRTGNPLFGVNDEYYLRYKSKHMDLGLGDNSFGLSQLTEASRSGRGLMLNYVLNKVSFGAFYNIPRYYPLINQVYSAHTKYTFSPDNELSLGFLSKRDTNSVSTNLFMISSVNKFLSAFKTDVEVAIGQNKGVLKKAYKGSASFNSSFLFTSASYVYAEPDFPGYLTNSMRFNAGLGIKLKNFSVSLNYDQNKSNLALDTIYSNMPFSENLSLSASYRLSNKSNISFGGFISSMQDKSAKPLFDNQRKVGRVSSMNRIGNFSFSLQADAGEMTNFLINDGQKSLMYNGSIFLGYVTKKGFSANLFGTYQGGQQDITGSKLFYYGGSLSTKIMKNLSVSLQYNSNFEWQYYTSDRSLFSLDLSGQINRNNEISLGANYNLVKNTLDNKEYNVRLRYVHTFNVPVTKKKNIGSVTGKILNHGVDKVSGVRLNFNGILAISDKDGNFRFPTVPIGSHTLGIDAASFGINAVTETPGPYTIKVDPAKVTYFEFAMTKSARIEGTLKVQEDEKANQKGYIPVKEQISKLIVEVSNGSEMFRNFTDKDGLFRFEDLRPGDWKFKVYSNGLPRGYKIVTDQFNVSLKSGETKKLQIDIQKSARQIQFQKVAKK
jgi:hypothetical protein